MPAMTATSAASSGQRVSRTSSLWMFWTVLKPISGRNSPNAISAVTAVSRSARTMSTRATGADASGAISHLLHVGPAEDALRQEDHGDGENGEGGDVLVVDGEVRRPQGLDETDEQSAEHGARQRADSAQHRGSERLDPGHEAVGEAHHAVVHEIHGAGDRGERGRDHESDRHRAVDVDAEQCGHLLILLAGA